MFAKSSHLIMNYKLTVNVVKTVNSLFFLGYNIFELYFICRWCDEIRLQEPEPMRGCILLWMGECVSIPWHQANW
ncbi:Odorant receptor [Operophtera brumata]|uniref:Odorant receptor n=1 Tax=Operophtera brumata TaxID=104452 RepID=A0A0L7L3F8_OPEBR|nr:Odorant receptor [Operophtera brumata]